jgi:GDP-L-fucose synthase
LPDRVRAILWNMQRERPLNLNAPIFVAGGSTPVGRALLERLRVEGFRRLIGAPPDEPDLTDAGRVAAFFAWERPRYVFLAAGRSGGIGANRDRPADLMLDNLLVGTHVIREAWRAGVSKLLYLASSCSYPRLAPQPMRPEALLTGPPEPTSDAYAVAKLAGWKLCEAYRRQYAAPFVTAVPTNPFGPFDDFTADSGHVLPALMRRMHEAKRRGDEFVVVWGSGRPVREFLYVRDLADACLFVMRHYGGGGPINLGGGQEVSIANAARLVAEVVGYRGRIVFDAGKPDGAPRKALDSGALFALGWRPATDFRTALEETYAWFCTHEATEGRRDELRPAV